MQIEEDRTVWDGRFPLQQGAFRYRRLRTCLLWFSATMVTGMFAAPAFFSSLMAGHLPFLKATSDLRTFQQADFIREFDSESDRTRIVALLSPT